MLIVGPATLGCVAPTETRYEYIPVRSAANVLLAKVSVGATQPKMACCARLREGAQGNHVGGICSANLAHAAYRQSALVTNYVVCKQNALEAFVKTS